jgi:hypothetical protein
LLFEFAARDSTFAGYFEAEGKIVVLSTNAATAAISRSLVREALAKNRIYRTHGLSQPIMSQSAKFSFRQLAAWREIARENARELGIVMLDLNEGKNLLSIEVRAGTKAPHSVRAMLVAAGVPSAAIDVTVETPAVDVLTRERALGSSLVSNLHQRADSLVGGLRWTWFGTSSDGGCTIGFTASGGGGETGFVTAGHCSPNKWITDGTSGKAGQPSAGSSDEFGFELYDPSGGTCPYLWFCSEYRFSDASFVKSNSRPVKVGYLATPTMRHSGSTNDLSTHDGMYIPVTAVTSSISQGSTIDYIGSTRGWRYGSVDHTCADRLDDWPGAKMTRCVYSIEFESGVGDSGGPVFYWIGGAGTATAAGLIFKKSSGRSWFSKWMYVESELTGTSPGPSSLTITVPSPPPTSIASIFGPLEQRPNASCYWYVSANFEYTNVEWRVNGTVVGTNYDLTYSSGASFTLEAAVWNNGNGRGATTQKSINVHSGAAECFIE